MIGMKLARPKWFDATALCIGSMMPDLMYSFSDYVHIDTHLMPAAFVCGIPLTVATALIIRYVIAPVRPAMLPDLGSFRLRSYAVLSRRRPPAITTLLCSTLGDGAVGTVVAPLPQGPIDILVGGDRGFCVWRAVGLAGRKDGTN